MPLIPHERIRQILDIPRVGDRRAAVAQAVDAAIEAGAFTITDTFLLPEPLRSDVHEHLDGVAFPVSPDIPQMGYRAPINAFPNGVLLVHRLPTGSILCTESLRRPVFGSNQHRIERVDVA